MRYIHRNGPGTKARTSIEHTDPRGLTPTACLLALLLLTCVGGCKKTPTITAAPTDTATTSTTSAAPAATSDSTTPAKPGSLADRLNQVESAPDYEKPPVITLPNWKPVSASTSSIQIPIVDGLVEDSVVSDKYGDHESIRTLKNVQAKTIDMQVRTDLTLQDPRTGKIISAGDMNAKDPPKRGTGTRTIDVADFTNAHHLMHYFRIGKTEHFPGSLPLNASAEVINQLRSGTPTQFDFQADPTTTLGAQFQGHATLIESQFNWNGQFMYKCTLRRVGTTDLAFPVLVNGVRVDLPVIHGMCPQGAPDTDEAHFYFLDQPSNAILLATVLSAFDSRSQTIKIEFPLPGAIKSTAATDMEQQLAQKKKVQIYGIYFDFDSSTIKPESEVVLKEISDILHKNPTWKLSVAGHTDNVGDGAFNQSLSERRSASVKNALVTEYNIAPDRLSTSGYGASQPIDTNTTVEGRARNRRVELQQQ
ncbi:MAG: OmpA family protein [Acidobacteriaceae bacterium]